MFQWAIGFNFSVAVQVGYMLLRNAVEPGSVMLVYLHKRSTSGWLARIQSIDELERRSRRAVHACRPKLLTKARIISIAPMLWRPVRPK